ncbi:hypothetical protein BD410DRAFT_361176 [Rickenella mellea]|uniref:Uncharacterized protein n=1 Tax=Rickenella mellea TaxID=50990 RepID=A0A4Y7PEG9_9AGAM|nr:hypothetical protein BD410DRAFT_361176 [Rickenella mellea]
MSRSRRLFLHASALSDQEYTIYLSAVHQLLGDADKDSQVTDDVALENTVLGADWVRGWMKGVYSDVSSIDQILQMFAPSLAPTDTLTVGHILAALRLVMHARSGAPVAGRLVFVQKNHIFVHRVSTIKSCINFEIPFHRYGSPVAPIVTQLSFAHLMLLYIYRHPLHFQHQRHRHQHPTRTRQRRPAQAIQTSLRSHSSNYPSLVPIVFIDQHASIS